MPIFYLDTNVFIRAIVNDDNKKYQETTDFFRSLAAGNDFAETNVIIIAEIIYVLTSKTLYHLSNTESVDKIMPFVLLKNLAIDEKNILITALSTFANNNLDFVDCWITAKVKSNTQYKLFSYDKKLGKLVDGK
jgi:predicted nucleic acid-binding protein